MDLNIFLSWAMWPMGRLFKSFHSQFKYLTCFIENRQPKCDGEESRAMEMGPIGEIDI